MDYSIRLFEAEREIEGLLQNSSHFYDKEAYLNEQVTVYYKPSVNKQRKHLWRNFKRLVTKKKYKSVLNTQITDTGKYDSMFDYNRKITVSVELSDCTIKFIRHYIWINRWDKPLTNLSRTHWSDDIIIESKEGLNK